ncbi:MULTISPECIES: hypothetical protein [Romboutsia]|uniref:hypothetical protein n=1 Tax=Romboutsia TaxID=1501226 RepID=UPI001897DEEC|nr:MULTISPECIES: hypothetical protein [Romboutsia]MCH1959795.1 hypothetical protein [Romboutsia hominis]MCH1969782.1 hypothetical protein [Romboutsia hominis]MDB8792546.1 hypothetical protein [Romboutsia sp. 1001216sp1]MDB8796286.1 hypothetical protein [Romboutsia sp. 1001216sp1]MDB8798280.1 hypothetical protein [Romboutsia sp. 1001216sp1]
MEIYLPKIIANSPTKLPILEKTILYYIIDKAFKSKNENTKNLSLEININEIIEIIKNTSIECIDVVFQTKQAINNLKNIKLSLVDNGFHIKLKPIENISLYASTVYVDLNPIVIEYLDQILFGNYIKFDLLKNSIVNKTKTFI